jgi:hypothetical protein
MVKKGSRPAVSSRQRRSKEARIKIMETTRRSVSRLAVRLAILSVTLASTLLVNGQEAEGVPWDWTHDHLVFSHPGTADEAIQKGAYEHWLKIAADPRYMMQLHKRSANASGSTRQGLSQDLSAENPVALEPTDEEADADVQAQDERAGAIEMSLEEREAAQVGNRRLPFGLVRAILPPSMQQAGAAPAPRRAGSPWPGKKRNRINTDWSETLGSGATTGLGQFPAVFTTGSTSCTDFVVFSTGLAGSSSQASIVAFNNLYSSCNGGTPTVYWAYNTGGTASLSPVLSLSGSQIAFVQSSSSVASLVLLTWKASNGTLTSPASPSSVAAASYNGCTAPCMTTLTLNGSPNDTSSSPFVAYNSGMNTSTLYVGDDAGVLHRFTNIFASSGTPGEATTGGWPVTVNTNTNASLASPVYDAVSAKVFVGDYLLNSSSDCEPSAYNHFISCGYLYSVNSSGTVTQSAQLDLNSGILDAPIVDSTTGQVYAFAGDDGSANCASSPCAAVYQFPVGFSAGAVGTEATVGPGYEFLLSGAFDNAYFTSSGTGRLYVVGNTGPANNTLYQISINSGTMSSGAATAGPVLSNNYTNEYYAAGLQVTEFYPGGANDYIFLGVLAYGNVSGCVTGTLANGCVIGYNVYGGSATLTGASAEAGGTSGIVVDNGSAGAQNIYFSTLLNQSCKTSGGTGDCAIQTVQSAP